MIGPVICGRLVSREAAKARRKAQRAAVRGAVFEYEYEYRPRGRTEYEYEGGGQWAVGRFGLTRSREGAKGNAGDSVRCLVFDQVSAGGSVCS
ncbi:MAG: hypothetical protein ACKON9_02500, partial [Planctomycetaceae bacterium]